MLLSNLRVMLELPLTKLLLLLLLFQLILQLALLELRRLLNAGIRMLCVWPRLQWRLLRLRRDNWGGHRWLLGLRGGRVASKG